MQNVILLRFTAKSFETYHGILSENKNGKSLYDLLFGTLQEKINPMQNDRTIIISFSTEDTNEVIYMSMLNEGLNDIADKLKYTVDEFYKHYMDIACEQLQPV